MKERNGSPMFPPKAVARKVGELKHDVVTLARLQFELFQVDLDEWAGRLRMPVLLLGVAAAAALGCVPVLLLGISEALVAWFGLSPAVAHAITACCGLIVAGVVGFTSWRRIQAATAIFARSKEEFSHNVRWMKEVLQHDWPLAGAASEPRPRRDL
jgi:hypothetical protein